MSSNLSSPVRVGAFLIAGSLAAQITASVDNVSTTVLTADSSVVLVTRSLPPGPIQNGAVLNTGTAAVAGTDAAQVQVAWQNTTASTVRYDLRAEASATGNFSYGCYCVLSHRASASAQTDLWLSAPQPTRVRLQVTFATSQPVVSGSYATVDLDLDGNPEFYESYATGTPRGFLVAIGPVPTRVRVEIGIAASLLFPPIPNGYLTGLLRVEATPALEVVSGHGQVGPSSEPFAQPISVRVFDAVGQPVVGAPVTFTATGPVSVSPPTAVTNGSGIATTAATALAGGGFASVHASSQSLISPAVEMFVRHLDAVRTPNSLDVSVVNAPVAAATSVPMVFAIAPAGIAPLQTFLGPICTNPFDPGTLVFEDSLGLFGFVSLSGQGASGAPDLFRSYPLPSGVLSGVAIWMQGVGFDADRGLFRTNCAQRTL